VWDRADIALWFHRFGLAPPFAPGAAGWPAPHAAELAGDAAGAGAAWLALGLPFEAAMALLQVQGSGAGAALTQAVALLEGIGAQPAAAYGRTLARSLGQAHVLPRMRRGPYSAARTHPQGLTAREAQILELLLAGHSNADIARHLVRSPRTVEHHVSALLDKLGASNRVELMSRQHQQG